MDRLPAIAFPIPDNQFEAAAVGRRGFLKGCGAAGLAVWGLALAGCESAGGITQAESKPGDAFFADGTDFAD